MTLTKVFVEGRGSSSLAHSMTGAMSGSSQMKPTFSTNSDFPHMCCVADLVAASMFLQSLETYEILPYAGDFIANPSGLSLATDFSGLETPSVALASLGVRVALVSVSEIEPHMLEFIKSNFHPERACSDVFKREPVYADVYVVGPPCVRFSHLGLRRGQSERR